MFSIKKRGVSKKIAEGILSMIDGNVEQEAVINESSSSKFTELKDIEKELEGKELPYLRLGEASRLTKGTKAEMTLVLGIGSVDTTGSSDDSLGGVAGKSEYSIAFSFDVNPKEDGGLLVDIITTMPSISAEDFLDDYSRNPKANPKQFDEIVALSDTDRFFISYKQNSLDLVAKRIPLVRSLFDLIDVYRDPRGTLGVTYNKRKKRFELYYNPDFILLATLEEWAINGKRTHETLVDCYIFTLGFLLAHEMSHIIGHDTDSSIGKLDVNSIHHYFDNVFQDSYINVMLGNILKGVTGVYNNEALLLSNGIGRGYSVRSSRANGGFKLFKSTKELTKLVADTVSKTSRISIESVKTSGDITTLLDQELPKLVGGIVFLRLFCASSSASFRSSNSVFVSTANSLIKALISGDVYPAGSELTDEEKKKLPTEVKSTGLLVGSKVRDKKTKKIGVVVEDSGEGIKVVYPDDLALIDVIIEQLRKQGKIRGGGM